jgi:hypothetical protein
MAMAIVILPLLLARKKVAQHSFQGAQSYGWDVLPKCHQGRLLMLTRHQAGRVPT